MTGAQGGEMRVFCGARLLVGPALVEWDATILLFVAGGVDGRFAGGGVLESRPLCRAKQPDDASWCRVKRRACNEEGPTQERDIKDTMPLLDEGGVGWRLAPYASPRRRRSRVGDEYTVSATLCDLRLSTQAVPGENGGGGQAMAMPWEFPAEARQTHLVNSTSRSESKPFTGRSMYSALSFEVSREWMLRCSLIRSAMKGSRRT